MKALGPTVFKIAIVYCQSPITNILKLESKQHVALNENKRSRGMTFVADASLDAIVSEAGTQDLSLSSFSIVILPGGFGGASVLL